MPPALRCGPHVHKVAIRHSLIHLPVSQFASSPKGQAQLLTSSGLGLGKGHEMTDVVRGVTFPQGPSLGGPVEPRESPALFFSSI